MINVIIKQGRVAIIVKLDNINFIKDTPIINPYRVIIVKLISALIANENSEIVVGKGKDLLVSLKEVFNEMDISVSVNLLFATLAYLVVLSTADITTKVFYKVNRTEDSIFNVTIFYYYHTKKDTKSTVVVPRIDFPIIYINSVIH